MRSVIQALTGNDTISYTSSDATSFQKINFLFNGLGKIQYKQPSAAIQKALVDAFNAGNVITLATGKNDVNLGTAANPDILPGTHAYTITKIDLTNPNNPQFTVRNPWGRPGGHNGEFTVDINFLVKYFPLFVIQNRNS